MVWRKTKLSIVDSCGGLKARCIGFFQKNNFNFSKSGSFIQVSVIKSLPRVRSLKGRLHNGIVVNAKKNFSRVDSSSVILFTNSCVLLKKRLTTYGKYSSGPIQYTIKRKRFIASFSNII